MNSFKVVAIQLVNWEEPLEGLWLAENEDWVLLRRVPVDYVVDGYVIIAKHHILAGEPLPRQKTTERVLRLKGIKPELPAGFVFSDVLGLLGWVEQRFGMVQFQDEEDSTFLGWLKTVKDRRFQIDSLTAEGKVDRDFGVWFNVEAVQVICFDDDYFNSMKLLWQDTLRRQWKLTNN